VVDSKKSASKVEGEVAVVDFVLDGSDAVDDDVSKMNECSNESPDSIVALN
jgi:hypothetical protein